MGLPLLMMACVSCTEAQPAPPVANQGPAGSMTSSSSDGGALTADAMTTSAVSGTDSQGQTLGSTSGAMTDVSNSAVTGGSSGAALTSSTGSGGSSATGVTGDGIAVSTSTATTGNATIDPGTEGDGDITISPPYADAPELGATGAPHGNTYQFTMSSLDSAIYRGDDSTLNTPQAFERAIRVYVPAQYVDGTPAPLLVVQDGYLSDIERAVDNLIVEGSVPALVLVFVANGGGDSKGSQRGLEYDTMSDRYSRFITTEVLPAVASNAELLADYPNFSFTSDPEGRGAYGCSSGGAAAFTMGWFTTAQFHRIITYSGTFVDQQDDDAAEEVEYPLGAWEYHERLIADSDPKPLRVFLEVGENDNGAGTAETTYHNWVMANQRMAAALAAKGYHYRFVYAEASGHCDAAVRRQTLPDTLRWMWRGYQ